MKCFENDKGAVSFDPDQQTGTLTLTDEDPQDFNIGAASSINGNLHCGGALRDGTPFSLALVDGSGMMVLHSSPTVMIAGETTDC